MKITKSVLEPKEEIKGIQCDRCKKEYFDLMETQEFLQIDFIGGYFSIFGDGDSIKADVCQYCLMEIAGSFLRVS